MKKLLACLLALSMVLAMAACSDSGSADTEQEKPEVIFEESDEEKTLLFGSERPDSGQTEKEDEPEEEEAEEDAPAEETPADDAPAEEVPAAVVDGIDYSFTPSGAVPSAFEPTVLVDNDQCSVTVTAYDHENDLDVVLTLELVNKTESEIMFSIEESAVNGLMFDPYWACSVNAGESETSYVFYEKEQMAYSGINYLQEVVLKLRIYNSEDYSMDPYFEDKVTLMLPSAGSGKPLSMPDYGFEPIVLLDNRDYTVAVVDYEPDADYGPALIVFAQNRSDRDAVFNVDNGVVNGVMCNPYWTETVYAGYTSVKMLDYDTDTLQRIGINYLQDITMMFEVLDAEDYSTAYETEFSFSLEGGSGPAVEEVFYEGFEDVVLLNQNGIGIVAKNFDPDGYWGPEVTLYLVNSTDKPVFFSMENSWVNGKELNPYWAGTVFPNAAAYATVDWDSDEIDDEVGTIEIAFRIYNPGQYGSPIYEGTVTLDLD